ncbi:PREDICTED: uncharacterized protein C1orf158 homolog [Branchiostoma belcheri]|uniref:Uncharacterized protein C1orf158 homolog n=1 Tax=Branchiostoma belcheri TaxID=7741 RepID=A0A6P4ZAG5_BRABE|nr:PREDICTED: uncharacterized protein C1orf158 homolog [Branchiostoma belcheri]KAI8500359.1 hypothetical protein Bbelb_219250 [Branchiostoma belcheri]
MAQGDPRKWNMPGWRIEQRYANRVLIGNWSEERYQFEKGRYRHTSTHRLDFRDWKGHKPDITIRRAALQRNEGLPKSLVFDHHGKHYSNNMISWYDQQFNKRELDEGTLPKLRSWDSHRLAWAPEKSDYPLQGNSTNWGLYPKLQEKWRKQNETLTGEYNTIYNSSWVQHPTEAMSFRKYATPKPISSHLHQPNKVNKDLTLRSVSLLRNGAAPPESAAMTGYIKPMAQPAGLQLAVGSAMGDAKMERVATVA